MVSGSTNIGNSLLDRLIDLHPQPASERMYYIQYDERAYEKSVLNDINALINTRSGLTVDEYLNRQLIVNDYGLPDLRHLAPIDLWHGTLLVTILHQALKHFETRLHKIQINLMAVPNQPSQTHAVIEGELTYSNTPICFSFAQQQETTQLLWQISGT